MSLVETITQAMQYADENGIEIPTDLYMRARRVGAVKAKSDIAEINRVYRSAITEALISYFEGGSIAPSRNKFKKAMIQAFADAFDVGWMDGGNTLPIDEEALAFVQGRMNEEIAHIDMLFQQMKDLRKDEEFDYFAWTTFRADGYIQSAASMYNAGRLMADKNKMVTWKYGVAEHCPTCQNLNGQRHRASWYMSRNYYPGKPGASMDCGGYRCKCKLVDDKGKAVTL